MKPIKKESVAFDRLLFFSDAVFAIAVTLLAIDLRLRDDIRVFTDADLVRGLLSLWPKYLSFLISFYVISRFWVGHHRVFRLLDRIDDRLISINILFLLFIVVIPLPTDVLGKYTLYRSAVVLYGSALFFPGIILLLLWLYAVKDRRCIGEGVSGSELRITGRALKVRLAITPGVFALSVGVAFLSPIAAISMWAALGPVLFIVSRVMRAERRKSK